jgi:hypothetical protein
MSAAIFAAITPLEKILLREHDKAVLVVIIFFFYFFIPGPVLNH